MFKAGALILTLLLILTVQLAAQDSPDVETEWDEYPYDYYARGDQTFFVNLGVAFPILFVMDGVVNNSGWKTVGGGGTLIFNYYLLPRLYIGGEVGVMFIGAQNDTTAFLIPLGARVGTQFIAGRFEFPIAFTVGVSWRRFQTRGHFGFMLKGSASALFRATAQWAFGLTTSWYFMPEWTRDTGSKNVYGNFLDVTLTARYHF